MRVIEEFKLTKYDFREIYSAYTGIQLRVLNYGADADKNLPVIGGNDFFKLLEEDSKVFVKAEEYIVRDIICKG